MASLKKFIVTNTALSLVELPCETVEEAIDYLNDPDMPPVEMLKTAVTLVTDDWDFDTVEEAWTQKEQPREDA